jgi:putative ABC transport system permease protein
VQADGGISPAHVLTARFSLPDSAYADEMKRRTFVHQLAEKVQSIPGVELAGIKQPLFGGNQTAFIVEGQPMPKPGFFPSVDFGRVTPDALQALGIRLLQGRFFDTHDNESGQKVCIIDETFAKQYFTNENPLGKHISLNGMPRPGQPIPWTTIIGVVGHVKNYGIDQPSRVEAYVPFPQVPAFGGTVVLRAAGDPSAAVVGIRAAIRSLDPNLPVFDVRPLPDIVAAASAPRRLAVTLIGSFAALALLLAAVGIYGVISYLVTQRRREIGIRIALGATSENVLSLILMKGARLAAFGVAVGLLGALAVTRLISRLLFQVSAFDVTTFAVGIAVLVALVLLACWLPARRATRIDPLVALRYE